MLELFGGPDRDRTDDLFHAMEARSQLRHRPTLRKDSLYSGRPQLIRQRERELIGYLLVSKDNRVSEHSACAGAVPLNPRASRLGVATGVTKVVP